MSQVPECGKGNWLPMSSAIVAYNKYFTIHYAIATKRGRKESIPIHRFLKRGDAGQRWIEMKLARTLTCRF